METSTLALSQKRKLRQAEYFSGRLLPKPENALYLLQEYFEFELFDIDLYTCGAITWFNTTFQENEYEIPWHTDFQPALFMDGKLLIRG